MSIFVPSVVLSVFQNTGYLLNITFIFDRCHRSSAAVTLVKYECDSNGIPPTFAEIRNIPNGEMTERIFSDPHPGPLGKLNLSIDYITGMTILAGLEPSTSHRICAWFRCILCTCGRNGISLTSQSSRLTMSMLENMWTYQFVFFEKYIDLTFPLMIQMCYFHRYLVSK